jgi:hypothetical protein
MKKKSILSDKRPWPVYGSVPRPYDNPVGDADLHIQGLSQPLSFKDMTSVFPEKVIFDLILSVAMVEHNTTVVVSPIEGLDDEETEVRVIENVYEKQPAVLSISWSKPVNVHCVHQGAMRPNDPSWTIVMPYDTYQFDTLGDGETTVQENQYYSYGGLWDTDTSMDNIARVEARFLCNSDDIDTTGQDTFGQAVRLGGVQMQLRTTQTRIMPFGAYKMHAHPLQQNNGLNDDVEPYTQHYKSMHYEMLDQTTMRMHFVQNNTS